MKKIILVGNVYLNIEKIEDISVITNEIYVISLISGKVIIVNESEFKISDLIKLWKIAVEYDTSNAIERSAEKTVQKIGEIAPDHHNDTLLSRYIKTEMRKGRRAYDIIMLEYPDWSKKDCDTFIETVCKKW